MSNKAQVEAAVKVIRDKLQGRRPTTISAQQQAAQKSFAKNYTSWTSPVAFPPPKDDDARQILFRCIESLSEEAETFTPPEPVAVSAEWVGYRRGKITIDSEPTTDKVEYEGLMRDVTNNLTMMHVHGGAFFLRNPDASRGVAAKLCELTGGRCISIHYRLAPQHPFPAALLDNLIVYLSLLYPPEGTLHSPVPPSFIVLTGDSSGANLCLSLIQVILNLGRQQSTSTPIIRFNGKDVQLPLPAGLAAISAFTDLTHALPSAIDNRKFDILRGRDGAPYFRPDFPACPAWPSDPPRGDLYCDISALTHPLVSPTAAASWVGGPPMLFICGEELFADSNKLIVQRAAAQGVCVRWEQYETMPHIFMLMLRKLPHSELCFKNWARFCQECVGQEVTKLGCQGTLVRTETLRHDKVELENLTSLTFDGALSLMRREKGQRKVWPGPTKVGKAAL